MSEPLRLLLGESDTTLRTNNDRKTCPPAAPSRGAVGDTGRMKNRSMSHSTIHLQLSATRGKAKLRLDNNTVFRDVTSLDAVRSNNDDNARTRRKWSK